jgi:hypothetical protein
MITNASAAASSTVANDIRDIKPPLPISTGMEWLGWLLGALAVLIALYALWWWWRQKGLQMPMVPRIPPHVRARQKLAAALELITQPKPFCIEVSDVTRAYLEARFDFRAPERTTEEFLRELGGTSLLTVEQKESLGRFLESCDLVKFARYEPGETELRALHESAVRLIAETEPPPAPEAAVKH